MTAERGRLWDLIWCSTRPELWFCFQSISGEGDVPSSVVIVQDVCDVLRLTSRGLAPVLDAAVIEARAESEACAAMAAGRAFMDPDCRIVVLSPIGAADA
jgi:hypothetical protein